MPSSKAFCPRIKNLPFDMARFLLLVCQLSLLLGSTLSLSDLKSSHSQKRARSLFIRQSCGSGYKACGSGCIPASYTCCPDRAGGCPADEYCSLGTNGKYGCCPDGKICGGSGGALTDYTTSTSTSTYTTRAPTIITQTSARITGSALSWVTATVTYDSGGKTTLSYAYYEGGYVPISVSTQLQWETTIFTLRDGGRTTATIASYPADGVADNLDWVTLTATLDNGVRTTFSYAYYDGGYITSSDNYIWSTRTRTFSDGDIGTFTVVSYKPTVANVQTTPTSTRSATSASLTALSTRSSLSSTARSTSSTSAITTPSQIAASSDGTNEMKSRVYELASIVAGGTIFLVMLWL